MSRSNSESKLPTWASVIMIIVVLALILTMPAACGSMVTEQTAINAAEDAGYTDIEVVDKSVWFVGLQGCDKNDTVRFTVRGTNVRNEEREFYVCAGVFKGGTIRSK